MPLKAIDGLYPSIVWKRFYEISQVPRPSKSEERIRLYLRNFAGQNNFDFIEDETGNIVILVPPTPGYENKPTVVIQNHVDMVCEKNKGTEHDFTSDPIVLVRDGEWIKANGTTLGADNGIGAAAALAIATENDFDHGPLELLFTVDEETGLTGANTLKKGFINGKILLNLDTEEDGAFYVGCSGGMDTAGTFRIEYEDIVTSHHPYMLFISGLKGGHSGLNISEGRANAIKLLALLLERMQKMDYQLVYLQGGSKRNAIAREAEAIIFIDEKNEAKFRELINEFAIECSLEYKYTDPDIRVQLEQKTHASVTILNAYKDDFKKKIINTILAMPHGVVAMNPNITGLVETSTNLATLNTASGELTIGTSQRSSIESAKRNTAQSVISALQLAGAKVSKSDGYPGWQPNLDSKILKLSQNVFNRLFGKEPEIKAVHAGLECGILGDKYPGLDMISFGPTIEGAHSPEERVNIQDVDKFYRLLKAILTEIAEK
ncbi:MAG: aminoacyl-histidine dipeptidase [Ignavibacteria bacterium]|nr:MAG: aminoacyl-histidine dipeptidase [Ignavibacteria bacterium]KAF0161755.1 MAG: aminoacyl-histidine dipeptidase [Ignavibacteria bacterium]